MKCLVAGDLVIDRYLLHKATKLCPEAPVPVLIETGTYESRGGSGLVAAQLRALLPDGFVEEIAGSVSRKERYFADGHLLFRRDFDCLERPETLEMQKDSLYAFERCVVKLMKDCALLIISDYGKGAFSEVTAGLIMRAAKTLNVPVLVDAKYNWSWFKGAFAFFPNEHEKNEDLNNRKFVGKSHIVHKLGSYGCSVDGAGVPLTRKHEVRDTTGAGDIFLAAFASQLLAAMHKAPKLLGDRELTNVSLIECARYANSVAGISVEHLGTYVVNSGIMKPTFDLSAK